MQFTTFKEAAEYVGGFSEPSKMPCYGYSIPAKLCKVGSILRQTAGSVCSRCYAFRGNYRFQPVQNAQMRRFEAMKKPFWLEAMVFAIKARGMAFFRWFDSGDLQSVEMLASFVEIAKRCPKTKFWLPTREAAVVNEFFDNGGERPKNLTIRLSASMIDGPAPVGLAQKHGLNVSQVTSNIEFATCRSFENGNECGTCRKCWNSKVFCVTYKNH